MQKTCQTLIFFCLCFHCFSSPVSANTLGGKFILSLNPGLAFFAMQDMNTKINDEQSGFMGITPSENLSTLSLGLDLGNALQYGLNDNLVLGIGFSYLSTNTSAKVGAGPLYPPQDEYYEINVPAVELGLLAKAAFALTPTLLLTIGGEVTTLGLAGAGETLESRGTVTGRVYSSTDLHYQGATFGFKLMTGIDFFIWEWLSLGVEGGYRHARFEEVRAEISGRDAALTNQDGSHFTLDYSGAFIHYTFRFYF
ncbi:hypothetical protein K8S19_01065 [bacterium]|nr:hypothetical protein [bacterium]